MGRTKRIGIVFTFTDKWLGGVYYIVNLINSFNFRKEFIKDLPTFVIFYSNESERFLNLFSFPNVEFVALGKYNTRKTFLLSTFTRKNLFYKKVYRYSNLDGLYPFNDIPVTTKASFPLVSWYPDLQHKFYPEYFKSSDLSLREFKLKCLLKNTDHLVLSSQNVLNHFNTFYDLSKIKTTVMPFVSLVDKKSLIAKETLLKKYEINEPYFLVSNQFYKHKNHITLLKAIILLQKKNFPIKVLMTGLMEDYRSPEYIHQLKELISKNNLSNNIDLLGVIPRDEQLSLMKYSLSVIQPSLFEGWSTVVEDAKSLNANIIASDIEIHKEQLENHGLLFDHSNANDLANKIMLVVENPQISKTSFEYNKNIINLSKDFENIFC